MKMNQITVLLVVLLASTYAYAAIPKIWGFHFHVYYFPKSQMTESRKFHELVQNELKPNGHLANCVVGNYDDGPVGPHPIAQFVTCCNATSLPTAIGFFMKTRDSLKLPILLHPLTKSEKVDHTTRAMWMGPSIPLDISVLPEKAHEALTCNPADYGGRWIH